MESVNPACVAAALALISFPLPTLATDVDPPVVAIHKCAKVFSDRPMQECVESERKDQERRTALAEEKRRKDRRDMALLLRYPTRTSFERERRDRISQAEVEIRKQEIRLVYFEAERKSLRERGESYGTKPFPPDLRNALNQTESMVEFIRVRIDNLRNEIHRINSVYDSNPLELEQWGKPLSP